MMNDECGMMNERRRAFHSSFRIHHSSFLRFTFPAVYEKDLSPLVELLDRKSTRLNSSHDQISYAVFCLKKKKNIKFCMSSRSYNISVSNVGTLVHQSCRHIML